MKSFSVLLSIEKAIIKNKVLEIIKSPKRLITYTLYIAFMAWVLVFNSRNFDGFNRESMMTYGQGGVFIFVFMMAYGLTKKSSIFFKMSEVNLIFSSPVDPRKLLLFTLLKRIPQYLFTSVITLVFLLAMVISVFNPSLQEVIITGLGYSLLLLTLEPLGFCLFAIFTKKGRPEMSESLVKKLFILIGLIAGGFVLNNIRVNGFSMTSVFDGLRHQLLNMIPIVGWGKALTVTAMTGVTSLTYIYLSLMVLMYIALVGLTYFLGTDYYEDVIGASEKRQKLISEAKQGKNQFKGFHFKKKKVTIKDKYKKAGAIHWKKKMLTSKSDLSVYLSLESLLCLILSIGGSIFMEETQALPYMVMGLYFYIKFLFSMNTSLDKELNKHFFYTIPDNGMRKLVMVSKIDVVRFFINACIVVMTTYIMTRNNDIGLIVLPFAASMFYVMMLLSSFTLKLFFTAEDFNRLLLLFKMFQMILVMMPSAIAMMIIGMLTESVALALLGSLGINLLLASIFLALGDTILNRMELK
ncbi:hypothetical protein EZV73_03435 [Acidaminobacter sp. JC074]|uniref:putative ABC exporter domain-containing protein n=1 Tax=Acidaminobacter sp. JC074 TaxID=2530199 RepID=UPI001F1121AD|nr:putative ABC exporter domain-containing protein [Acidaminobacter sp. JC074]MCH4886603.1 hypothetical protein [Acidaminobacter sp. JC074]